MDTDLALVAGLLLAAVAVPSLLTSMSEGRAPRVSWLSLLIACGLIGYALMMKPGGYRPDQVPEAFFTVLARFF